MKALLGLLGTLVAAAVILAGPTVWWLDRRPLGSPPIFHWHVLLWSVNWPGDSLFAKGERAAADLGQCRTNEATLTVSIAAQNRAVTAMKVKADQMTRNAQEAVQRAEIGLSDAKRRADSIMVAKPVGANECVQAEALIREEVR